MKIEICIFEQKINNSDNHDSDLIADVEQQVAGLVFPGFLVSTPEDCLSHLPRYFAGIQLRLSKAPWKKDDDRDRLRKLKPHLDRLETIYKTRDHSDQAVEYRWMVEEYRISLFAQELGTQKPVSSTRLENLHRKLTHDSHRH